MCNICSLVRPASSNAFSALIGRVIKCTIEINTFRKSVQQLLFNNNQVLNISSKRKISSESADKAPGELYIIKELLL